MAPESIGLPGLITSGPGQHWGGGLIHPCRVASSARTPSATHTCALTLVRQLESREPVDRDRTLMLVRQPCDRDPCVARQGLTVAHPIPTGRKNVEAYIRAMLADDEEVANALLVARTWDI